MDLSAMIRLLGDMLGAVLYEQESQALLDAEERIRLLAKARRAEDETAAAELSVEVARLDLDGARVVATAFALYFDLVNLAEEDSRVNRLRERERSSYPDPIPESVGAAVKELRARGLTPDEMAALLRGLQIELVLTAHPTEARRRTLLSKLKRIADLLYNLGHVDLLPAERTDYERALKSEITSIWLTNRTRTTRMRVTDEARTGLFFVDEVLWPLLPRLHADLNAALDRYFPGLQVDHAWLRLASWTGGDRDGNPNVTAPVTAETLRLHRGLAVERHRRALQALARKLSMSAARVPPPAQLVAWLESRHPLPPHVAYLEERYKREPYRLALSLLAADLAEASRDRMTERLLSTEPHTARARVEDFVEPLKLVAQRLPSVLAADELLTLRRQFAIFGLHAARLDIREDARRLNASLGETLRALRIEMNFEAASDAQRKETLMQLLAQDLPRLAQHPGVTAATAETWALFQLLARTRNVYGRELLGPFITSMTRSAADVLAVLTFARWTGCAEGLDIVPLFETLEDLQAAPGVLAELFQLRVYRDHLATCNHAQMVMIGYSDSNKDGGYLAANWALYQAQERIAAVCREHDVRLTLFHGRGGTVARGGGPANRAIQAQPPNTIAGRFRVTVQGETISARFSNPHLAHRNLDQTVSAVLLASAPRQPGVQVPARWQGAIEQMSSASRAKYRGLVYETPGFMEYWQAATPLEEISRLQIGSRPPARTGGGLEVLRIRAIPWVFSWMQSRYNLPSWYGLGAGLTAAPLEVSQEMYAAWPFFQALLDNAEMALLKADMGIAALYSELVPDRAFARSVLADIRSEYERTGDCILTISGHDKLMDADPVIQHSVEMRNPYVDPLNYVQVEMLRRLRALPDQESAEAEAIREVVALTINGIAAGLRNTG